MLVRLTMICNGATAAMRRGAFPRDEPLEPRARVKAAALRQTLRRADRAWTSPALRARQTAEAVLSAPASIEPLLADQDQGRWAGKSFDVVQAEEPDGMAQWLADPMSAPHGGESLAEVARRGSALMERLIAEPGHTIAVTHASVIRAAMLHVIGAPLAAFWKIDIEPLSVTEFRSDGHRWVVRSTGVTVATPHKPAASPTTAIAER